jgi:hypothetical protein
VLGGTRVFVRDVGTRVLFVMLVRVFLFAMLVREEKKVESTTLFVLNVQA